MTVCCGDERIDHEQPALIVGVRQQASIADRSAQAAVEPSGGYPHAPAQRARVALAAEVVATLLDYKFLCVLSH